jgi:hypothetical protein
LKGCYYFSRDILFTFVLYSLAIRIDGLAVSLSLSLSSGSLAQIVRSSLVVVTRWIAWCLYFYWQGIAFAGLWCLGHEAGHGTLSIYPWLNTFFGFTLHTVSDVNFNFHSSEEIDTEHEVPLDPLFFMALDASRSPCESSLLI